MPYLDEKVYENVTYPKVLTATTANRSGLASFSRKAIGKIPEKDIQEAREKNYPCVLIVGQLQYRNAIHKILKQHFPNIEFTQSERDIRYSLVDGYELLLDQENSNLG